MSHASTSVELLSTTVKWDHLDQVEFAASDNKKDHDSLSLKTMNKIS